MNSVWRWLRVTISGPKEVARTKAGKEHLAAIVESSEDAIFTTDRKRIIQSWNRAAQDIYGYAPHEIIGQSIGILAPDDLKDEPFKMLEQILRGQAIKHYITRHKCKDGQEIAVAITMSPMPTGGKVTACSVIARDITEQLQNTRELEQTRRLDAVGQLARGVAHDFNHTLGLIKNYLRFVERDIRSPDGKEDVEEDFRVIRDSIDQGEQLARRLTEFSHAKDDNHNKHVILNQVIEGVMPIISFPGVEVVTDLTENLPRVFLDPSQTQQIIINLALNARDAMPDGGCLRLRTYQKNGHACLDVCDTGHGMTEEIKDRALTPFFTTKTRGKGTGLGLSTVYGIVSSAGGRLDIVSAPGKGTTVCLCMPVDPTRESRTAPIPGEGPLA